MKKTFVFALLTSFSLFSGLDVKSLFEGKEQSGWVLDPTGYFALVPPANFKCEEKPGEITCKVSGEESYLHINAFKVPKTASLGLVALNQYEKYESELHFQMALDKKTKIGQLNGLERVYTYDYLGNVNYPVWVQLLQGISGRILYQIKFKCIGRSCSKYQTIGKQIGSNFRTAATNSEGLPVKGSLEEALKGAPGYQGISDSNSNGVNNQLENILKELE